MLPPPKRSEIHKLFGLINYSDSFPPPNNKPLWREESVHMTTMIVDPRISKYLINSASGNLTTTIYINRAMRGALEQAFKNLLVLKAESELKTFDGCFGIRKVRGDDTQMSLHSWGLAIDLNAADNPLNAANSTFSREFIKAFTFVGFTWGGDFKNRPDPMHFQWCIEGQ